MNFRVKVSILLLSLMIIMLLSLNIKGSMATESKPLVVVSTTVLGSVVEDLARDQVVVYVVANPAICPAHYDIKPSDILAFREAKLILYHGFEPWIKQLVDASGSRAPIIKISGPWNTPTKLKELYVKVAKALSENLGLNVETSLDKSLKAIDRVIKKLKSISEEHKFSNINVIVMKWQRPFVSWLGFNVIADYPPPERLSTKDIAELESKGRESKVCLIIDNLQSGVWFGEELARRVNAVHVVLTNFPGTGQGLNNITRIMEYNVIQLVKAIENYKVLSEIEALKSQLTTYQYALGALIVIVIVETVLLILVKVKRK